MTNEELMALRARLKSGEYDGTDIMSAWLALDELIAARKRDAEPVAWMHVQGNHFDPSLRQLDDDEKARGWTEFPLYGPDGVAAARTELWDAIAELVVACGGSAAQFDEAIADRIDAAARGVPAVGIKGDAK